MENKDGELLKQLFAQRTFELADNGFIRQAVQELPWRLVNPNRIWVVFHYLLGVVLPLVSNASNQLRTVFSNFVDDINGWVASIKLGTQTSIMVYLTTLAFAFLGTYQAVEPNR